MGCKCIPCKEDIDVPFTNQCGTCLSSSGMNDSRSSNQRNFSTTLMEFDYLFCNLGDSRLDRTL